MSVKAEIVIHSFGAGVQEFEVLDFSFPDIERENTQLEQKLTGDKSFTEKQKKDIMGAIYKNEALCESLAEELSEYGDITPCIHKELWEKFSEEKTCRIIVSFDDFRDNIDYFTGEYDWDYDWEYSILEEVALEQYLVEYKEVDSPEEEWDNDIWT